MTEVSAPAPDIARRFNRVRIKAVVVDCCDGSLVVPDRLDEELDVVARVPLTVDSSELGAAIARWKPKMVLIKPSLETLSYSMLAQTTNTRAQVLVLAQPTYGVFGSPGLGRFGGMPWIRVRRRGHGRWSAVLKRGVDLGLVLLSAPMLLPVLLVLTAVAGLDGPPLYFQERVGERGRRFRLVKFRTMYVDAERASGPVLATVDDPRLTRMGRLLRRFRLDELPQLWNVLRGEMSLVGPRPERPEFVSQLRQLPNYDLRHMVRPGITGIAQLTSGYHATIEDKLRCDLLYLGSRSLRLDMKLLVLTLRDLVRGFPRG